MSISNYMQSNTVEGVFAAVNSSGATMVDKEGYFVVPTGSMVGKYMEVVLVSAVTDDPLYLLMAGAAASKPVEIAPLSPERNMRCVAGATISAGQLLTVHTDATAVPAVNGSTIIGYAEEDVTVPPASGGTAWVKFRPWGVGANTTATAWYDGAATTLADPHNFVLGTVTGTKIGTAAAQKLGFYNATPAVQPAHANQTAVTDSTTGSVADAIAAAVTQMDALTNNTGGVSGTTTFAAGVGEYILSFPISNLSSLVVGGGDLVTAITIGHRFQVMSWRFITNVPGVGAGATFAVNMEIGTTDVGTVVSTCTVTEASTSATGEVTLGTAVSGAATGSAADTFSIEHAAGTVFTAGSGVFQVLIKNLDTADAISGLTAQQAKGILADTALVNGLAKTIELTNAIRSALVTLGIIKGSA